MKKTYCPHCGHQVVLSSFGACDHCNQALFEHETLDERQVRRPGRKTVPAAINALAGAVAVAVAYAAWSKLPSGVMFGFLAAAIGAGAAAWMTALAVNVVRHAYGYTAGSQLRKARDFYGYTTMGSLFWPIVAILASI